MLAAALQLQSSAFAQAPIASQASAGPPRIGLALSGGGARGIAHIGVLKVMEEMRVPVHCITGTSIGSIVGGGYATGASAASLEKTVLNTNWNAVFNDRPPRSEISIRRKADDYKTLFAPEYGVTSGGLALPKGILSGVSIEAYFRALTESTVEISDFQKLPIPFRALATDIETGESIVLDRGSVAQAMRASMSVPGAMAPVEINGRLLVDGGIANNLPIDEARKLCGDVIIAVNISTPPLKREQITSALSVSLQLINFLGKQTVERQIGSLTDRDILISPDLGNISAGSFERGADAIAIGEKAARAMADSLSRYSLSAEAYAALRAKQLVANKGLGTVDEIRFEGLQRTNPEVLRSQVQTKPGEPLSEERIAADLRRIYGRGDFESIDYRIQQEPGKRVMLIQPREKTWGPDYLRFGLGLATDFHGENPFNVLVSYRKTWMNSLGGEWLNELQVGRDSRLFSEFYQPIDERGRYFIAPYGSVGQSIRGVFVGETRVAEYNIREARVGVDAGAVLGTWGEARIGPLWKRVDAKVDTGSSILPGIVENSAGVKAKMFADQLDSAFYARKGYYASASVYTAEKGMGSDRNYQRGELDLKGVKSWGAHTFNVSAIGGSDLGSSMPAYEMFTLGGPLQLSGYRIGEFQGSSMRLGRIMYYNRALPLPDLLGAGLYVGASAEVGKMMGRFDGQPNTGALYSGSVFLGADTFLGPAYFGLGVGEAGRMSLYLLIGAP
jgi:NTE family protein